MGVSVSIVSTGNPKIDDYRVESLDPGVGELEVGFAAHIGEFDSLVDTISDETGGRAEAPICDDNDVSDRPYSAVLALLKSRHNCESYISTMTRSQRIIRDDGLIFGPSKAKDHVKQVGNKKATEIVPPKGFGTTVQTLLEEGVTHSWKYDGKTMVRAWSLPEFWELTSWPRDSAGASNVRFGFPVVDDLDSLSDEEDDDDEEEEELEIKGGNPFITEIAGVKDLTQEILSKDKNCVLFLSAKYCRTCKTIAPAYSRYARINQSDDLVFATADTTSPLGKELSRTLEVNAVPLFVFFKKGERFGTPLSMNKLPSKRLDLAIEFLAPGSKWDSAALDKLRKKDEERRK